MKTIFALLLLSSLASAEPMVIGFERFHRNAPTAEGGRLLFNELGCANCHDKATQLPPRKGPNLNAVFTRIDSNWTRDFLLDPQQARPGATMPHLGLTDEEADSVVHYLASLTPKTYKTPRGSRHVNAERGSELFHRHGCASCHSPSPDFHPADGQPAPDAFTYPHIAYPDLAAKYDVMSLSAFLRDPLKSRPHGRMPKLEMEVTDSIDIAAHLLDFQDSNGLNAPRLKRFTPVPEKVSQGRAIVEAKQCAACHEIPKVTKPELVPLSGNGGCLTGENAALPQYHLSESQSAALAAFLSSSENPPDRVDRRLEALNCYACHDRNGKGGPDDARKAYLTGDPSIGDTGRYPPPLTGTGRKLQPDWLEGVLKGENRVRDYVHARMPIYGELTDGLAQEFAEADRKPSKPLPATNVAAGRKLVGTQGGLNCIICHQWGDRPSLGIQALDISNLADRLQPGWLESYLLNPAAYRPGTLMPPLWPGGVASNQEILGGDTRAQIAAIYAFAKEGNALPEGYPETVTGAFELVPSDRPIIQRAFMEGVGAHAIAVGFPSQVHFAYDAEHCRPMMMWKGQFFDAYGTWFIRSVPFETPLGSAIVSIEGEPRFEASFRGYKLDDQGIPTFLYEALGESVEERLSPIENGFERQLTWEEADLSAELIQHPEGVKRKVILSEPDTLTIRYTW